MGSNLPLTATNLSIGYKGKSLLTIAERISFSIAKGQLYGLIGINGIGKSTLIKTLSGLLPPLGGQVLIKGQNVFKLSFAERAKHISLVLTERVNAGLASVEDIVKMGRYPYTNWQFSITANDQKIINLALHSVGLYNNRQKLFNELSDGNKQKAMIAKALAQDTPILILDEPTIHLDIKNRFVILELLQKLTIEHQKAILFSGHDLDYMLKFCNKMMLMTPNDLIIESPTNLIDSGAISKAFDLNPHEAKNIL